MIPECVNENATQVKRIECSKLSFSIADSTPWPVFGRIILGKLKFDFAGTVNIKEDSFLKCCFWDFAREFNISNPGHQFGPGNKGYSQS